MWKNGAAAGALVLIISTMSTMGCAARRWDGCAMAGAVLGSVGGAVAADQGLGNRRGNQGSAGIAASAVAGLALGAIVGHVICDPRIQPEPPPPPSPPPAPLAKVVVTEEQIVTLEPIYFDFDKATIRPESFPVLDQVARVMTDRPHIRVRVEGHTDSRGTAAYNQSLSEKRARSVVSYLNHKGIDSARSRAVGFGAGRPIAPNQTPDGKDKPEGRAKNRRTEFHIES